MDRSKVAAAFPTARFVGRPEALADHDADLVLVDLGRPGVLDVVGSLSGRVVGFASHVDAATIDAAVAAGVDEALARSVFFRRIPAV
jgi:DNA-binding NarL/FixJ family response regulator